MAWEIVKVEDLNKNQFNYKGQNPEMSRKLRNNLEKIGLVENLIVRQLNNGSFEIVNGEHRYDELLNLNKKHAVVYNLGKVSEKEAIRICIETNETNFDTDQYRLGQLLDNIEQAGNETFAELEEYMPFSEEEMQNFQEIYNTELDNLLENNDEDYDAEYEDDESPYKEDRYWLIIGEYKMSFPVDIIEKWLTDISDSVDVSSESAIMDYIKLRLLTKS